ERGRVNHLRHAELVGGQTEVGVARKETGEPTKGTAHVQHLGWRDHVRPVENVVLIRALGTDVTAAGRRPKARLIAILLAVLPGYSRVQLVVRAEDVVPAKHWLVVIVAAHVCARDEVVIQPWSIRRRVVGEDSLADGADALEWYHVSGERIANESTPRIVHRAK